MRPVIQPTLPIDPVALNTVRATVNSVFDSALISAAVIDPSALVDVSAIRDQISHFVNLCIAQRTRSLLTSSAWEHSPPRIE
ncbi:hypothetical protein EXIGLDRAFT_784826 [Exidia glandulosa HHB12029]|uniref:Uncharacterized protein n=1 Tax=Exidia glandulosa HHB12029 TaxID=1314781 RepID=A0A166M9K5_EXIGL|nr:hypothetical protein EXIGLDRAFT_784826 [Exidia glandulosa HHB12029]